MVTLPNLQFPPTPEDSITVAEPAIAEASKERADSFWFRDCFVPGYRGMGKRMPPADSVSLDRA
jgi:hypothetical protein